MRIKTIGRWKDRVTGVYHDPPEIVEVSEEWALSLVTARCAEILPEPEEKPKRKPGRPPKNKAMEPSENKAKEPSEDE